MNDYFVDAHCHLDLFKGIEGNPSVEDAKRIKTITVTNAPFLFEPNQKLFGHSKNVRVALGMHPELVVQYASQITKFREALDQTRYIGEIGIDGSAPHKGSLELQERVFQQLLEPIKAVSGKVITVHSRGAARVTIDMLATTLKASGNKVILHWFTGTQQEAKLALDAGFYFSINHKMVSSDKAGQLIRYLPVDRILTETDAPFTFDHIFKERLQCLSYCVDKSGEIKGVAPKQLKQIIFENFRNVLT